MFIGVGCDARVARNVLAAFAALCLFMICGCQTEDALYLKRGPAADLAATDTVAAGRAQSRYFQYLCTQSGLPSPCVLPVLDSATWTLIVHQGMNDIDRRCDAYLQWLDDKKRSRGAWQRQISDTSAATTAIMAVVNPESAVPLQIVGQAFNLLSRSIENYNSRLLFEVESSTVNSVVLRARADFRQNIQLKAFSTRPDAEYALREYMRRCMPYAIETQINNLSTLGAQGIVVPQEATIYSPPVSNAVIGQALVGSLPMEGGRGKVKPTPQHDDAPVGAKSKDEKALHPTQVAAIQRALCVKPDNGSFGPQTRQAILQLKQGLRHGTSSIEGIQGDKTDTLNTTLIDFLQRKTSSCVNHERLYANAFEKYAYQSSGDVQSFQQSLQACVSNLTKVGIGGAPVVPASGLFDSGTRNAIKWARHESKAKGIAVSDDTNVATEDLHIGLSQCRELEPTNG
ncbi:hypothetical protein ELG83_24700 (plasmid) [Rhizobium leguminosarum]|uniref:Uncharacterized protein n=1 Tax=Rhizobium leguminosarum bv. viciae TaxID=387 RepID=A0A8I2KLJ0_RHILV|nr:hypothetical protein [Rhizobium leguminosarum]NKM48796.1 hypothetical protein [Rhizobium leguminosarum bv. viciae]TBF88042.1 hypothetical protein ELG83_24700 [Rhizobium leguminosarum]